MINYMNQTMIEDFKSSHSPMQQTAQDFKRASAGTTMEFYKAKHHKDFFN